jgi:hypothetical protein
MHADRGKLLFRVNVDKRNNSALAGPQFQRLIWDGVACAMASVFAYDASTSHRVDWSALIFFAGYGLSFVRSRKVLFYENGIYFPEDPAGGQSRFIAWRQIERYHWDADVLTVMPATSLLGGAGSLSGLYAGGTVRVPTARRVQVENLLSAIQIARI